jgi:hypothetical protein
MWDEPTHFSDPGLPAFILFVGQGAQDSLDGMHSPPHRSEPLVVAIAVHTTRQGIVALEIEDGPVLLSWHELSSLTSR